MKQSVPAPVAAAIVVVLVGVLGFFLYNHFLASPSKLPDVSPHAAGKSALKKPASQQDMKAIGQAMMQGKGVH